MNNTLILIIESNLATRKMMRNTLDNERYQIIEAEDGVTALKILDRFKPDLILQDLLLPDMDGIELNQRIRAHENGRGIPILAVSGFLGRLDETEKVYEGFNNVLVKPIAPSHLLHVIRMYLPQHTAHTNIGKGKRILIADDDATQLKFLGFHLEKAGFSVNTATDGKDALQQAMANPPDAIISDVLMPKMDGFDLCIQCRQHSSLANIPIILITNHYIEESDKKLAAQSGANGYIMRTGDPQPIINALISVLSTQSHSTTTVPEINQKTEHINRLVHQLELQITANSILARQCAQQTAQLNLLNGIAEALTNKMNINHVLHDILASCLDTAGVSKGILYMIDRSDDTLHLKQHIGYPASRQKGLSDFFGNIEILTELMDKHRILELPSKDLPAEVSQAILSHSDVNSALIIPLHTMNGCSGVLILGYKTTSFTKEDLSFAHMLGMHIIQAISLAETFELLSISEMRYRTLMDCASCGILLHDCRGIIIEMNRHSEQILLNRKEQVIGRDFNDFIDPKDRGNFGAQLSKNPDASPSTFKCQIHRSNGTIYEAEISMVPVKIGNENLFLSVVNSAVIH